MSAGRRYLVRGVVQGVGFRWWTRSVAERIGVAGAVRNLADGSVEVRARAEPQRLEQLAIALRDGPPGARVDSVEEQEEENVPSDGFEIVG